MKYNIKIANITDSEIGTAFINVTKYLDSKGLVWDGVSANFRNALMETDIKLQRIKAKVKADREAKKLTKA